MTCCYLLFLYLIGQDSTSPRLVSQVGHSSSVSALAFSPDGNHLAGANGDNEIFLWELSTGKLVRILKGHLNEPTRLRFEANNRYLWSAALDGSLRRWDLRNGTAEILQQNPDQPLLDFDLREGKLLAVAEAAGFGLERPFTALLLDVASLERKPVAFMENPSGCVSLSRDGKTALTGSAAYAAVLWDLQSGKTQWQLDRPNRHLLAASFSPDGRYIACSLAIRSGFGKLRQRLNSSQGLSHTALFQSIYKGTYNELILLDTANGEVVHQFSDYALGVSALDWLPDSTGLVTGTSAARAMLAMTVLSITSTGNTYSGAINPSGFAPLLSNLLDHRAKTLGVYLDEEELSLWNITSGRRTRLLSQGTSGYFDVSVHPSGRQVAYNLSRSQPVVMDIESKQVQRSFGTPMAPVKTALFSPEGSRIISISGKEKHVNAWDMASGRILRKLYHPKGTVTTIAFHPSGRLVSGDDNGEIYLWDLLGGKPIHRMRQRRTSITAFAFVPGSGSLISAADVKGKANSVFTMWDMETGLKTGHFETKKGKTRYFPKTMRLDVSPDGRLLAFGGHNFHNVSSAKHRVGLWDLQSGKRAGLLKSVGIASSVDPRFSAMGPVRFHEDGTLLTVGPTSNGDEAKLVLWQPTEKKVQFKWMADDSFVTSACFLPDGDLLTGSSGRINHWNQKGKILRKYQLHHGFISALDLHPDGEHVLSGGEDGMLKLWRLADGKVRLTFTAHADTDDFLIYTPTGYYTGSAGGRSSLILAGPDNKARPLSQSDRHLNRPDKVLENYPEVPAKILALFRALVAELPKAENVALPEVEILNRHQLPFFTKERNLEISVKVEAGDLALQALRVWVNGVLTPEVYPCATAAGTSSTHSLELTLSAGRNAIKVAASDQNGSFSPWDEVLITTSDQQVARDLYLVVLGVSDYADENKKLVFARKDAEDISSFFQQPGLGFRRVHQLSFLDEGVTRECLPEIRAFLKGGGVDDQVFFFLSGHGLLSREATFYYATHDMDFDNPTDRGIAFSEFDDLLKEIAQREKLLLIDSCHSGSLFDKQAHEPQTAVAQSDSPVGRHATRGQGRIEVPEKEEDLSYIAMQSLLTNLIDHSGTTVFAASRGAEAAQERYDLSNGIFTYFLLQGLRTRQADLDRDQHIMPGELMRYCSEKVAERTGGLQNPTFRAINPEGGLPLYPAPLEPYQARHRPKPVSNKAWWQDFMDHAQFSAVKSKAYIAYLQEKIPGNRLTMWPAEEFRIGHLPERVTEPILKNGKAVTRATLARKGAPTKSHYPKKMTLGGKKQWNHPAGVFQVKFGNMRTKARTDLTGVDVGISYMTNAGGYRYALLEALPAETDWEGLEKHLKEHDYLVPWLESAKTLLYRPRALVGAQRLPDEVKLIREKIPPVSSQDWRRVVVQAPYQAANKKHTLLSYHYLYKGSEGCVILSVTTGISLLNEGKEYPSPGFQKKMSSIIRWITVKGE